MNFSEEVKQEEQQNGILLKSEAPWHKLESKKENEDWLWENYLAKGHITLFSALWKSGKSTLIRALLMAMYREEEFAGQSTKKANVFILTEENEDDWVETREDFFGEDNPDNIYLSIRSIRGKPNLKEWKQIVIEIKERCVKLEVNLVIIDTISVFMPIVKENDSGEWLPALVPLWELTDGKEMKASVMLVHHFSKEGGTEGRASRGSGALPGFVSNIIELRRVEGDPNSTQRKITTYGRFQDAPEDVVLDFNPDTYKYETLGNAYEVSKAAKLNRIIKILEGKMSGLSITEIKSLWDEERYGKAPHVRSIRRYVLNLTSSGQLFVIKEEVVRSKKTPFYAIRDGWYQQDRLIKNSGQKDSYIDTPPVLSSAPGKSSGQTNGEPVRSNSNFVARAGDRTAIGGIIEEFDARGRLNNKIS